MCTEVQQPPSTSGIKLATEKKGWEEKGLASFLCFYLFIYLFINLFIFIYLFIHIYFILFFSCEARIFQSWGVLPWPLSALA